MSYATTLVLAGMGSASRAEERPWIPLALTAKVAVDVVSAVYLTVEQGSKHHRFCSWCLLAAGLSAAMVPQVLPGGPHRLAPRPRPYVLTDSALHRPALERTGC